MAKLGELSVGSIVTLNVDGTARNFIVAHQGLPSSDYDSSCDGTWLIMEDLYESRVWDSTNNDYENSDIHSYLNSSFLSLLDENIQNAIKQVKIPYSAGTGTSKNVKSGENGLSTKIFLLSYVEVGFNSGFDYPIEGAALDFFNGITNSQRIGYLNGEETIWWCRSPLTNSTSNVWSVGVGGASAITVAHDRYSHGIRPALILSPKLTVKSDGSVVSRAFNGYVNIGGVNKEISAGYVNVGGVWKELTSGYANIIVEDTELPEGYTKVEYIQSSKTQFINTQYMAEYGDVVTVDMAFLDTQSYIGFYSANNNRFGIGVSGGRYEIVNGSNSSRAYHASDTERHTFVIDTTGEIRVDDTAYSVAAMAQDFSAAFSFTLFGRKQAATETTSFRGNHRVYGFTVENKISGALKVKLVSCINSEGVAGLYDKVNNVFLPNVGTGAFIIGENSGIWLSMA